MFFYSILNNQPHPERKICQRASVIALDRRIMAGPATLIHRPSSAPVHVSLDGKLTLCGCATNQMRLRLSDPVEWAKRIDACQKCKRIYRRLK